MPNARISQLPLEAIITDAARNSRITQDVIEAVISSVVTPAKVRVSQAAIEVVILYAAPAPVTKRYGPRIQAV